VFSVTYTFRTRNSASSFGTQSDDITEFGTFALIACVIRDLGLFLLCIVLLYCRHAEIGYCKRFTPGFTICWGFPIPVRY